MGALSGRIGARVRSVRALRDLSQRELGDRIGWSERTIGHIESGRKILDIEELPPLCRALGVGLAELLQDDADAVEALQLRPAR